MNAQYLPQQQNLNILWNTKFNEREKIIDCDFKNNVAKLVHFYLKHFLARNNLVENIPSQFHLLITLKLKRERELTNLMQIL